MLPFFAAAQSIAFILSGPAAPAPAASMDPAPVVQADAAAGDTQPAKKDQPEKPAEKKEPAKSQPPTPAPTPPADPSTEDLMKEMEKQRGKVPPPTPSTTPPGVEQPQPAPAAPPVPAQRVQTGRLLREGTFLVDRRGRMVRTSTGDWTYSFDADAKGQADPTMTIMPCQKLEAMEKLAERYGESLTFTVTGQVFVYHNRNHLLPATFRVNRAGGDIKSTQ